MAAAPVSTDELTTLIVRSGLFDQAALDDYFRDKIDLPDDPREIADVMVADKLLTAFQARHLLLGRHRGLVLGQYRLLEQIGKGGTGIVFLAEHCKLFRKAAIKVLPEDRADDREALERFFREARAVAMLDHPNIVRAHDASHLGKVHYFVMEYVDGESLQKMVERRGALPLQEAIGMISQVLAGLDHAHQKGLVHRDIKPSNLVLDKYGTIKILDMGLALLHRESDDTLTKDLARGAVLGTADYLSPEQALSCHDVDIRSDIYSLGATFYTLLTGQPPFHDSKITKKLIDHQVNEPPPLHVLRPELPAEISALVSRMMAKRPMDRFQSPHEVLQALAPLTAIAANPSTSATIDTIHDDQPPVNALAQLVRPLARRSMAASKTKDLLSAGGRFLLGMIFLLSGVQILLEFETFVAIIARTGLPAPTAFLLGAMGLLFAGSLSIIAGYKARIGACLLAVFLCGATFYFHDFWNYQADARNDQFAQFLKNVSMLGAMFFIIANGPGRLSIDQKSSRS